MINVDISNIWGEVALPDLLAIEGEVAAVHEALLEDTGGENRQWLHLPPPLSAEELHRIRQAAETIRENSQVCVVTGIDSSCLGARAAIELLLGLHYNIGREPGEPQIFFAGNSLSTRHWNELLRQLKDKDFSVIAVSGSGTALEPAIAFRSLRWMLERKYGTDEANRRIYAVTDPAEGTLHPLAEESGWECFCLPQGIRGGYSVLTAAGLLPMAVAGIDIAELLAGAAEAAEEYAPGSLENPVWQYAAVRTLLYRGGKAVEILASFEPGFRSFGLWWQQLFGTAGGKDGNGLFPATAELPRELCSPEQLSREEPRNLLETIVRFDPPETRMSIGSDWKDPEGLNYLEGKSLDFVEENAFQAAVSAHADSGIPVIVMECGELTHRKVGELFCFLELCCSVSTGLLGADPSASGSNPYTRNLLRLLGKPGWESE